MEKILSVQEIMAAEDVTQKTVPVEEWGGAVVVRSLSHRTMRGIRKKVKAKQADPDAEVNDDEVEKWVFIEGMVEPPIDEDEYELLMEKSSSAIQKILTAIMGSTKTGDKAVKEEEKSLPDGTSGTVPVSTSGEAGEDGSRTVDGNSAAS